MKKPWDTWVLKGLTSNEAAPLFEKMERIQMSPLGHAFGWKYLTLPDGRKVKLTIQKNGPVPIYTAIAEGGETLYNFSYVDSGYLNPLNLPPASATDYKDFPALYQSTRTAYLHHLGRGDVPNPNSTPPSFWYDAALYTPSEQAALQFNLEAKRDDSDESVKATGKYRLYQQARRGLPLGLAPVPIEAISNTIAKTIGLYTANDGTYWKVDIEAQSATPEVTFTKFDLTDEIALTYLSALSSASNDVSLILETYILSQLVISAESYTVNIQDGASDWAYPSYAEWDAWEEPEGQQYALAAPISPYHGWKFNWDGNKAAIVLVQSITAASFYVNPLLHVCDYRSHVLELTFSNTKDELGNYTFRADIETLETNDWQYSHRPPQYWIWVGRAGGIAPFYVRNHPLLTGLSFSRPSDTPVYCYYVCDTSNTHKNNSLEIARITFDPDTSGETIIAPCSNPAVVSGWANGAVQTGVSTVYAGDAHKERVLFANVEVITDQKESTVTRKVLAVSPGAWGSPQSVAPSGCVGIVYSVKYFESVSMCPDVPLEQGCIYVDSAMYFTPGATQSDYKANGDSVTQSVSNTRFNTARFIIPYDNAESIIVTRSSTLYKTTETTTWTYTNSTVALRLDSVVATRQDYSVINEVIAEGFNPNGYAFTATPSPSSVVTNLYQGDTEGELYFFGKHRTPAKKTYTASKTDTVDSANVYVQTVPGLFQYIKDINDDTWDVTIRFMQGIHDEAHISIDTIEVVSDPAWESSRDCLNGLPVPIEEDFKTVPIGFA